ncbi:MAG: SUF system NifU family Fe-S cluster assembly protein [Eubacteriales bacterium]|nr:SUF system NifU family Fe-S cluster assembly protein [Eubacteriales bacterium]
MELNELYNQIIVENSRATWNRHKVAGANVRLEGVNPSCGDDIFLEMRVENGIVEDAGFLGDGCAISQASTSMMVDLIKGKTVDEAKKLAATFLGMIKGEPETEEQLDTLEDAVALKGVSKMPARVKCAVLSWHTLEEGLDKHEKGEPMGNGGVTTE